MRQVPAGETRSRNSVVFRQSHLYRVGCLLNLRRTLMGLFGRGCHPCGRLQTLLGHAEARHSSYALPSMLDTEEVIAGFYHHGTPSNVIAPQIARGLDSWKGWQFSPRLTCDRQLFGVSTSAEVYNAKSSGDRTSTGGILLKPRRAWMGLFARGCHPCGRPQALLSHAEKKNSSYAPPSMLDMTPRIRNWLGCAGIRP